MKFAKPFLVLLTLLVLISPVYSQQYCIPGRFDTTYVFSLEQIDTLGNISYGQNINWQGNTVNLKYIISYPKFTEDSLARRPFILLMHGGGFYAGDKYDVQASMLDFSMRGYVCASIDYRIGWATGPDPSLCQGDGYSLAKAVYRAMQDSKAAFRYFTANAGLYRIDTNYMFTAGLSAGAVTSLMISFATQENLNAFNPNLILQLGLIDTATNSYRNQVRIKSAVSISGGLFDTSYMNSSNAIPLMMFHGTADIVVPYGTGYAYNCSNYVRTEGSSEIVKRYRHLIKSFELDYVPGAGHTYYYPIEYYQLRTVKFFKRYLCNEGRQIIIENYTTLLDTSLGVIVNVQKYSETLPKKFKLHQNYPNPFNPTTKIDFELPYDCNVMVKIYDIIGREIETLLNGKKASGYYILDFTVNNLSSGIYFYRISAGDFSEVKKMLLIK